MFAVQFKVLNRTLFTLEESVVARFVGILWPSYNCTCLTRVNSCALVACVAFLGYHTSRSRD